MNLDDFFQNFGKHFKVKRPNQELKYSILKYFNFKTIRNYYADTSKREMLEFFLHL